MWHGAPKNFVMAKFGLSVGQEVESATYSGLVTNKKFNLY